MPEYTIKLGDFLKELEGLPADTDLIFGAGNLEFYRTKWRGEKLLQIEFNQQTWPLPNEEDNRKFAALRKVSE